MGSTKNLMATASPMVKKEEENELEGQPKKAMKRHLSYTDCVIEPNIGDFGLLDSSNMETMRSTVMDPNTQSELKL